VVYLQKSKSRNVQLGEDPVQLTGTDVVQVSDKDSRRNSRGSAKGFDKLTSSKVTKVPKLKCVDKC
jgi:hypothetical protein